MVDADRAKWDYHPIMSSQFVTPGKADPGAFTSTLQRTISAHGAIDEQYVEERGRWIDETLLATAQRRSQPLHP